MPFPEGMEAGTMPFLDIIQLKYGFHLLNQTMGGMHVRAGWGAGRLGLGLLVGWRSDQGGACVGRERPGPLRLRRLVDLVHPGVRM